MAGQVKAQVVGQDQAMVVDPDQAHQGSGGWSGSGPGPPGGWSGQDQVVGHHWCLDPDQQDHLVVGPGSGTSGLILVRIRQVVGPGTGGWSGSGTGGWPGSGGPGSATSGWSDPDQPGSDTGAWS